LRQRQRVAKVTITMQLLVPPSGPSLKVKGSRFSLNLRLRHFKRKWLGGMKTKRKRSNKTLMRFSIRPPKKVKVKLQKAGGLLRDLMDLIGDLLGVEGQVDLEVRVDQEVLEALVTGALLVEDLGLLAVPVYHLGEDQVGQMRDHL